MMLIHRGQSQNDLVLTDRRKKKIQKRIEKSLNVLRGNRENFKLHIELGDAYASITQDQEADKHYSAAIEMLRKGSLEDKERKQIIMLYGKILSLNPDKHDAYLELAEEYVATGQKEKAVRFLISSAKKAYESDHDELALACYMQVVALGRSTPYIIERCTEIYLKLGKKQEAVSSYVQIGDTYAHEEKYIEALDYYKKANALEPDEPNLTLKVARMYYALEWMENAATELIKLGEYYEQRKNYAEAAKYYQNSLNLDRNNEKAFAGKQRVTRGHPKEEPLNGKEQEHEKTHADILEELDHLEESLKEHTQACVEQAQDVPLLDLTQLDAEDMSEASIQVESKNSVIHMTEEELQAIQGDELQTTSEETLTFSEHGRVVSDNGAEAAQYTEESQNQSTLAWQDRLLDLNLDESFALVSGLDDQPQEKEEGEEIGYEPSSQTMRSDVAAAPFEISLAEALDDAIATGGQQEVGHTASEDGQSEEDQEEKMNMQGTLSRETPATEPVVDRQHLDEEAEQFVQRIVQIEEERSGPDDNETDEAPAPPVRGNTQECQQKLDMLEKQLENTEEEKYFLQEQFAAQIKELKSRETAVRQMLEATQKDRDELTRRLNKMTVSYETARQQAEECDDARYDSIVAKIQQKKIELQDHLNTLLKRREENGRFLAEELQQLGKTKLRLQENLSYIQQVKIQVETRINTELRQSQEQARALSAAAKTLEEQLRLQTQQERDIRSEHERLKREKETLEEQFTETITALTAENETLGQQIHQLTAEKSAGEKMLKKKLHGLYTSYQQLKAEYKQSLTTKEQELNRTAQQLSAFADEQVKLEDTLQEIRQERDKLGHMLAKETATREKLEDQLVNIESQVDSLEVQGTELLQQLERELTRQLTVKHQTAGEFQETLEELEQLLSLQEREIHSLEVL